MILYFNWVKQELFTDILCGRYWSAKIEFAETSHFIIHKLNSIVYLLYKLYIYIRNWIGFRMLTFGVPCKRNRLGTAALKPRVLDFRIFQSHPKRESEVQPESDKYAVRNCLIPGQTALLYCAICLKCSSDFTVSLVGNSEVYSSNGRTISRVCPSRFHPNLFVVRSIPSAAVYLDVCYAALCKPAYAGMKRRLSVTSACVLYLSVRLYVCLSVYLFVCSTSRARFTHFYTRIYSL